MRSSRHVGSAIPDLLADVVVVGAGGNIGSHLVAHLARAGAVQRLTLIDRDVYERDNLCSQDITPRDVGQPKALVQARRLRGINPALSVAAIADAVENVPLAHLRGRLMATCLDSRAARQYVNEVVSRLGVAAWVDAGVESGGLLARVTVYQPGRESPCLECLWSSDADYALLEQAYPCTGAAAPAPTNAPSALGALAASVQAIECRKLLGEQPGCAAIGREILIDAAYHKFFMTRLHRNPNCRFAHDDPWTVDGTVSAARSLAAALRLPPGPANGVRRGLRVEGRALAVQLDCPHCGLCDRAVRVVAAAPPACRRCRCPVPVAGAHLREHLDVARLAPAERRRSLRALGLRPGDLLAVSGPGGTRRVEVGA